MKKKSLAFLLFMSMLLSSCSFPSWSKLNKYSKVFLDYFDTVTTVVGYFKTEDEFNQAADFVEQELAHFDALYDNYNAFSDEHNLYYINKHAAEAPVEADRDIIELFKVGKEVYALTNGETNFAMGAVLSIWHNAREDAEYDPALAAVPDIAELRAAARHCNIDDVVIDEENSTIYYKDPELKCDVGAIAKGYAIERIISDLKDQGIDHFTLNVGGNVRTTGLRGDDSDWTVAIQNPDLTAEKNYVETLSFHGDRALTTSGSYQRYFMVDGVRYHHIINPETLMPENMYLSVSILNNSTTYGDALSTALFNMSLEDGMALIESLDDTEAMWIMADEDMTRVYSSGFEAYIKK